ncbi:MAG: serine/threonine protein kinase [Planctomycetes bacterium]|nr:serine/threonine protein kinase [Planctomycetota bacterium]
MSQTSHQPSDDNESTAIPQLQELTQTVPCAHSASPPPGRIGPYRIRRLVASGGMGSVYEATQENPRRVVAVKVMKKGITSRTALRRFEFEAQLLARLRHPGIAQVYEAGTHEEAGETVPYFAMEYVPGARPVDAYARAKRFAPRELLELARQICDAVNHGHQKGIIHRDLKPSNVLVDSQGQVKVIDFGVARATDSDLALTTLQTGAGQLIGTLQYMSPEQCEADPHDIDARSDVYSLGVLFYELLCDRLPYDLSGMPLSTATKVIREYQPPRPSTVRAGLRGDVETIILKALEKDRDRRYRSAGELGDDIGRYLAAEAILARPASLWYQVRVTARRHRAAFIGAGAVVAALTAGAVASTYLYLRADAARAEVSRQRDAALEARAESDNVTCFLQSMLAAAHPWQGGKAASVLDMLNYAVKRMEAPDYNAPPRVEAAVRQTIGNSFRALGRLDSAKPHLRRSLELWRSELPGPSKELAQVLHDLGVLYTEERDYAAAEPLLREALEARRQLLGSTHVLVAESLNSLGSLLKRRGAPADAELAYREALAILDELQRSDDEVGATLLNNLGLLCRERGASVEAVALFQRSVSASEKQLPGDRYRAALTEENLALAYWDLREFERAAPLLRNTLAVKLERLPADHPDIALTRTNLAAILRDKGEFDEAAGLLDDAIAVYRRLDHPDLANALFGLGRLLLKRRDPIAAEPPLREAVAIRVARIPKQIKTAEAKSVLGECLSAQGRFAEAEPLLLEAVEQLRTAAGVKPERLYHAMARLRRLYEDCGRPEEAARWQKEMDAANEAEIAEGGR